MNVYTITNIITFLQLTLSQPTTLVFKSQVEYWSQSNNSSVTIYRSKNQKILSLKANSNNDESSLVVITKDGPYSFKLKSVTTPEPMLYEIKEARPSHTYYLITKNNDFELLDGGEVLLLKIKSDKINTVNDMPAKDIMYLPKNSKIKINNEFINL